MGLEGQRHKAGGASLMGCCWSSRLRKIRLFFGERGGEVLDCFRIVQRLRRIRLFLGDAVQNRSRDGKAEAEAEEGYVVILWGFHEILWDFNVLLKFVSV